MEKSESIKELAAAMCKFQGEVEAVTKEKTNPFFKSKYADIASILEVIRKPMMENGLSIMQFPSGSHELTTILSHSSGEYIQETYTMKPTKDDPQGIGSVITYQRRYALCAVLGLSTEDDDGNASVKNHGTENKAEADKPWMNENTFKKALERIASGEPDIIDKCKQTMKIRKEYMDKLIDAENLLAMQPEPTELFTINDQD